MYSDICGVLIAFTFAMGNSQEAIGLGEIYAIKAKISANPRRVENDS